MIKGFAHVCLAAADLDAVERFYTDGLGCEKAFDFIRDGKVIGFYLELAPDNYIEVFLRDEIDRENKAPILHFCLEVDDIEQTARRLVKNGYEATEKKLGKDRSWQIWTSDPSGVRIEFHQYTPESFQKTRNNCILD